MSVCIHKHLHFFLYFLCFFLKSKMCHSIKYIAFSFIKLYLLSLNMSSLKKEKTSYSGRFHNIDFDEKFSLKLSDYFPISCISPTPAQFSPTEEGPDTGKTGKNSSGSRECELVSTSSCSKSSQVIC